MTYLARNVATTSAETPEARLFEMTPARDFATGKLPYPQTASMRLAALDVACTLTRTLGKGSERTLDATVVAKARVSARVPRSAATEICVSMSGSSSTTWPWARDRFVSKVLETPATREQLEGFRSGRKRHSQEVLLVHCDHACGLDALGFVEERPVAEIVQVRHLYQCDRPLSPGARIARPRRRVRSALCSSRLPEPAKEKSVGDVNDSWGPELGIDTCCV